MTEPKHGDYGICLICGGDIEFFVCAQPTGLGTVEELDAWWAHSVHPQDGHDAVLDHPGAAFLHAAQTELRDKGLWR